MKIKRAERFTQTRIADKYLSHISSRQSSSLTSITRNSQLRHSIVHETTRGCVAWACYYTGDSEHGESPSHALCSPLSRHLSLSKHPHFLSVILTLHILFLLLWPITHSEFHIVALNQSPSLSSLMFHLHGLKCPSRFTRMCGRTDRFRLNSFSLHRRSSQ